MSFYKDIALYYDKLFPLKENKVDFLVSLFHHNNVKKVMDLACGNGELARALAASGFSVVGVDEEETLLGCVAANVNVHRNRKTTKRSSENENSTWKAAARVEELGRADTQAGPESSIGGTEMLEFVVSRMEELAFSPIGSLDAIICLGNSLPHLRDVRLIREVISSCACLLRPGGLVCLQIINFEMVRSKGTVQLPDLVCGNAPDGAKINLRRNYRVHDKEAIFAPELKVGNRVKKYKIPMYPMGYEELSRYLLEGGLGELVAFADYSGKKFKSSDVSFIVIARKAGAY